MRRLGASIGTTSWPGSKKSSGDVLALADAALGYRVRNTTYRNAADVSEAVAGNDLRGLVKAKLLEAFGEKRGRFYQASPLIKEIRAKVAEPKARPDPFKEKSILEKDRARYYQNKQIPPIS